MRDNANKSYFIKLPNSEESKTFIKVLRKHFKSPHYRVRVQANRYKERLGDSLAWRVYIQYNKTWNLPLKAEWWGNLDIEEIPKLLDQVFLLQEKTKDGELGALAFIKKKYPEVLMEYLMTQGGEHW